MNNWGGDKKGTKHLCICQFLTLFLGGIMEGEQLEYKLQGKGDERKKIKSVVFESVPKAYHSV